MKKFTAIYLMMLGVSEITLGFLRDIFPFTQLLHMGMFWFPGFPDSKVFLTAFVLSLAALPAAAGWGLLKDRRSAVLLYCVVGGSIAVVDLLIPFVVLVKGGGHVLGAGDAGLMLLAALFFDVTPVALCVWQLRYRSMGQAEVDAGV